MWFSVEMTNQGLKRLKNPKKESNNCKMANSKLFFQKPYFCFQEYNMAYITDNLSAPPEVLDKLLDNK